MCKTWEEERFYRLDLWNSKVEDFSQEDSYWEIKNLMKEIIDCKNTRHKEFVMNIYNLSLDKHKDIWYMIEDLRFANDEIIMRITELETLNMCTQCSYRDRCKEDPNFICYSDNYQNVRYSNFYCENDECSLVFDVLSENRDYFSLCYDTIDNVTNSMDEMLEIEDILDTESRIRRDRDIKIYFNDSQQILLPKLVGNNCTRNGTGNLVYYSVNNDNVKLIGGDK